jgi:hypothetical protein
VETRALLAKERIVRADLESKLAREREAHQSTSQQFEAMSKQLQLAEEEHTKYLQLQQQENQQIKDLIASRDQVEQALNKNKVNSKTLYC